MNEQKSETVFPPLSPESGKNLLEALDRLIDLAHSRRNPAVSFKAMEVIEADLRSAITINTPEAKEAGRIAFKGLIAMFGILGENLEDQELKKSINALESFLK